MDCGMDIDDVDMADGTYNVSMADATYDISMDPQNQCFQPPSRYFAPLHFLTSMLPFYWVWLHNNLVSTEQLAQFQSPEPERFEPRPSISKLLRDTHTSAQSPSPSFLYTILPANIPAEAWREESDRVNNWGGSTAYRDGYERQRKPVTPHFSKPPLSSRGPTQRAYYNVHRNPARIGSASPAPPSSSELRSLRLLKRESDAQQRLDGELSNRARKFAARHHRPTIWNTPPPPPSESSSRSSSASSTSSRRSESEPWASQLESDSPGSDVDSDADSDTSEFPDASAEQRSWASESESDSSSSRNSWGHSRRLSPPPLQGDRLTRMRQHRLSRETPRPGFISFLQTLMDAVTDLWPVS
ncbi:hypothetical protein B0H17DRAFT_1191799 [Mycena rosella]|uniref:Uncharacterized protein n=1 Tax=Mycena rosella TaxID=1033263 RepID=A0AAD7GYV3_MYCRO|nr:hypothetical protein B0H17DRAFT_1191799 [Mycena rosella]